MVEVVGVSGSRMKRREVRDKTAVARTSKQGAMPGAGQRHLMALAVCWMMLPVAGCASMLASHPSPSEALDRPESRENQSVVQQKSAAAPEKQVEPKTQEPEMLAFGEDDLGTVAAIKAPTVAELESLRKNLFRYVKNMVATKRVFQANLSLRDEEIIEHLMEQDAEARSALERAVLFIALLEHTVVEYDHLVSTSSQGEPEGGALLSQLSRDYGINVLRELKTNGILHHPVIYHMAFLVLHHVSASPRLITAVVHYLRRFSQAWVALHESMEEMEQREEGPRHQADPELSAQESITAAIEQQNALQEGRSYSMADFAEGDELISRARELHSQNRYREALEKLMQIPGDSPHAPAAKELTERYANDAVEELRQQAAQLFQDHLKVNSLEKKISFLVEAEEKLQQAIAVYPGSRWERKVQNNLAVIQKRLEEYQRMQAEEMDEVAGEESEESSP